MPHIHIEPGQHDHTVSAYIVRVDGDEPRLLLHRHKKLGVYMQIGGHIELDETPWQAISHELREETGYELDQLEILQPKERLLKLSGVDSHPLPFNHNTHAVGGSDHFHTDITYAFVATEDSRIDLEEGESSDIKLFTKAELQALSAEEIYENVRELGVFVLEVILDAWNRIPATNLR